jgi:cysteine synthase A
MPDRTRYYILGAFALGILLTAAYEKLSSNSSQEPDHDDAKKQLREQQKLVARFAKINDLDTLKKSLTELGSSLEQGAGSIKEGVEGCIGDTPLIKIKSLSDYTGCEILAKAEVCMRHR